MAQFTAEAFQNQYLSDGATDVHAIVRIDATGAAAVPYTHLTLPTSDLV